MVNTIEHLNLIQGVINRMAQASFILKGCTATLIVALIALIVNSSNWWYGLIGLIPACVFWGLDAYYLRQERLFRELYNQVRLGSTSSIPTYSMDTSLVRPNLDNWWKTLFSSTLAGLYDTLCIVTIIASIVIKLS